MTSLLDTETQRQNMRLAVEQSIEAAFPIEGTLRRIELEKVWVADEKDPLDFASQKTAKLAGRSYSTPVYASLKLIDKGSGKELDRVARIKLAELPVLTPRNSFIVKGNEYQVTNQLRLRPGVYTRYGADGKLSSQVNLAKGRNFKVFLDQAEGVFDVNIGTANVKLYPILKDLGVSDSALLKAWGPELVGINQNKSSGVSETEINKLYKKLFYKAVPLDREEAVSRVQDYFATKTMIDGDVTKFTLGQKHEVVSPQMLLDVSTKLLRVSKDEEPEDDRDHIGFKSIHSVDDFLAERLGKLSAKIRSDLSRGIDKLDKTTIPEIISRDAFHKPIESLFTQTQLSSTPEQINPLHMVAGLQKTTVFGEGGISEKALTTEARGVHSSQLGLLDPLQTPESGAVGAMFRLPTGARKEGDTLKAVVYDPKTGKIENLGAWEMHDMVIAFPDQFSYDKKNDSYVPRSSRVKAQHKGEIVEVPASKVDRVISTSKGMFGLSVNMIPFLDSNQGNRSLTAARMQEQALPLVHREEPLVQAQMTRTRSYEDGLAESFHSATFAQDAGTVTKVDAETGELRVKTPGQPSKTYFTYKNFPLNAKHFFDSELKVKEGDTVEAGQLMADTNYTRDGKLALGTNLNVAYIPYRGYNYEDGIVISDSAAEKLTSMHMYKEVAESGPDVVIDKPRFAARFPSLFTGPQLSHLDEDGVVKEGTTVSEGDPLILAMAKTTARPEDGILQSINRSLVKPFRNVSVVWNKGARGTVENVAKHGKVVEVYVRTNERAVVGDKLAGRHGNKGIIVKVLSDSEMPKTGDGKTADVLMNPHGVPSRINLSQLMETAVGKVADKQGKPILVKNFEEGSNVDRVKAMLASNGLTDTEEMFDGADGKSLGNVNIGKQFIMKLDHSVSKKFSARDTGGYTADELPGKGGDGGAQSIDPLLFYSLVSHGAKENLHEMATVKGMKNDEFWRAYQLGQRLPAPKPSFAFEKFTSMMKGLGVNVEKKGNEFSLIPMTDDDVAKISSGEIKTGALLKTRGMAGLTEEKGGLFDPTVTGGHSGNKWSHIQLSEPIPNPLFEDALKTVLGIKQAQFEDILTGRKAVNVDGELVDPEQLAAGTALVGGRAFETLLSKVNVDQDLERLRKDAVGTKGQQLNTFNKHIRYLQALKNNGLDPTVYVTSKIAVMPPKFRPIYPTDNGQLVTSDVNLLYKDLILANDALRTKKEMGFPVSSLGDTVGQLYNQHKLLSGLGGESTTSPGVRDPKGIIQSIAGLGSPKSGFYQSSLVRRRQDLSARSTIIPEPQLGVDEVGVPKKMLETLFRKPVIKRLVGLGYTPLQAQEEIEKGSAVASRALELEAEGRPVMLNRAPSLHKFNMMAFKPRITDGKAIKLHPLVVKGYNADFDGDTMALHVPVTDKAVKEAYSMLPTNNLFNPGTGDLMILPGQEAVLGLYRLTEKGTNTRKKFDGFEDARAAVMSGDIKATDTVTIGDRRTSVGRATVNMLLPSGLQDFDASFDSKHIASVLKQVAMQAPEDFGAIADGLKDIGNEHAYRVGSTISLNDVATPTADRDRIFREVQGPVRAIDAQLLQEKDPAARAKLLEKKVGLYDKVTDKINKLVKALPKDNNVRRMVDSGARGNYSQVRQMIGAPVLLQDTAGHPIPVPVTKSYAEGLDTAGYWTASFGARTGAVDRSMQTAVPGYFNKRLINTMIDMTVTMSDCNTRDGVEVDLEDPAIFDRYTAGNKFGVDRNTLVNTSVMSTYRRHHKKTIKVRSPMTCEAKDGVCAKCFGRREHGQDSSIGDNLGTIAAQAIAEPATQMQMKTFHTGGVASGGIGANLKSGFERILQLTELPSIIKGSATLSEEAGRVDQVTPAPAGGNYVFVAGQRHFIPSKHNLLVQAGEEVTRGQPLSDGEQNPHDILRLRGIGDARTHLSTELQKEYLGQGMKLKSPIIEAAVRSLTNLTRVFNPSDSDYVPGDYAPLAQIEALNRQGADIGHTPELKGINQAPLFGNEDWMSQLNFQNLKKTVVNAATKNWTSSIHGTNPIAAWVYGSEFGKGDTPGAY